MTAARAGIEWPFPEFVFRFKYGRAISTVRVFLPIFIVDLKRFAFCGVPSAINRLKLG